MQAQHRGHVQTEPKTQMHSVRYGGTPGTATDQQQITLAASARKAVAYASEAAQSAPPSYARTRTHFARTGRLLGTATIQQQTSLGSSAPRVVAYAAEAAEQQARHQVVIDLGMCIMAMSSVAWMP